jgi:hypothetical protein
MKAVMEAGKTIFHDDPLVKKEFTLCELVKKVRAPK